MQTACPLDPERDPADVRHLLFTQQCRSLLQVMRWLVDGRIEVGERRVLVRGARYDDPEYSPALDFRDAIELRLAPRPSLAARESA
jgi:phosphoribosylglycinamide formyltransferase-1